MEYFGEDNMDERLIIAFARFEEGQKEVRIYFLMLCYQPGLYMHMYMRKKLVPKLLKK